MDALDKRAVIRRLKEYSDGANVIKTAQFAKFLGVKHETAKRKLAEIPAYEGKYYLISDVADMWLQHVESGS